VPGGAVVRQGSHAAPGTVYAPRSGAPGPGGGIGQPVYRGGAGPYDASRGLNAVPRAGSIPRAEPIVRSGALQRADPIIRSGAVPRNDLGGRVVVERGVDRGVAVARSVTGRTVVVGRPAVVRRGGAYYGGNYYGGSYYAGSYYGRPYYRGGYYHPIVSVHVVHPFYRPYYAFAPRFSVGFGIFIGYPVAYPYGYVAPYPYGVGPYPYPVVAPPVYVGPYGATSYGAPSYAAGTPPPTAIAAAPPAAAAPEPNSEPAAAQSDYGGVSFTITPATATVYLDGVLAGRVSQFSATQAPLTVIPGTHRVELRAPGYQSASFEVTVNTGEVTPFEGALEAAR
jgi:hypothetical protein